jgi:hypothetical protein
MASLKLSCQTERDWTILTNDVEDQEASFADAMSLDEVCSRA